MGERSNGGWGERKDRWRGGMGGAAAAGELEIACQTLWLMVVAVMVVVMVVVVMAAAARGK